MPAHVLHHTYSCYTTKEVLRLSGRQPIGYGRHKWRGATQAFCGELSRPHSGNVRIGYPLLLHTCHSFSFHELIFQGAAC